VLKSIKTYRNAATATDGYYVLQVPSGGTLLSVAPPATGFFQPYFSFNNVNFDVTQTATVGGPCMPLIPTLPAPTAGNRMPNLALFSDASPPPPVFNCPR
jgi:hypothetical protein